MAFMCGRVLADEYPVEVTLEGAHDERQMVHVFDGGPFLLPKMSVAREWLVSVGGAPDQQVHEIGLATAMGRLG
jgi:hypothetical protein